MEVIKATGKAQTIPQLMIADLDIGKITPEIAAQLKKCKKLEQLGISSCKLDSV